MGSLIRRRPYGLCNRAPLGDTRRYSIIGITHTLSTPAPLRILADLPKHPFTPGCPICTSTAARSAVETIWNYKDELCRCRGGQPATKPQLPIIH